MSGSGALFRIHGKATGFYLLTHFLAPIRGTRLFRAREHVFEIAVMRVLESVNDAVIMDIIFFVCVLALRHEFVGELVVLLRSCCD